MPYKWDVERLQPDKSIPERLLMKIIGSKEKILFCEGNDKTSLDFKLYSILFKNYTIVPVGGHLNVINYCKAYNKNKHIYGQEAIGIIDGDYHSQEQVEKWKEDKIYTLKVNEIENLLCDEMLLISAATQFCCDNDAVKSFKNRFFLELEKDKKQQAVWYVNGIINNFLKSNMLKENKNLDSLRLELNNLIDENIVQKNYDKRLSELEEFIDNKNYEDALKICNFKGKLLGYLTGVIVDGYKDRIITLISNDIHLTRKSKVRVFFYDRLLENIFI